MRFEEISTGKSRFFCLNNPSVVFLQDLLYSDARNDPYKKIIQGQGT